MFWLENWWAELESERDGLQSGSTHRERDGWCSAAVGVFGGRERERERGRSLNFVRGEGW